MKTKSTFLVTKIIVLVFYLWVNASSIYSQVISGGAIFSYAVCNNGSAWACGDNTSGSLGNGTTISSSTVVPVNALSGIIAISASSGSLALKNDGTVWGWGDNHYGQVGDGTKINQTIPVQLSNLSGIISIAAGGDHSLALKNDGTVWAWGWNFDGQLGMGDNIDRLTPTQIPGLSGVIAIAGSSSCSIALKYDSTVLWWGSCNTSRIPKPVSGLSGVIAVSGGFTGGLALKKDSTLWQWGTGSPSLIPGMTGIVAFAGMVNQHSLAVKNDGTLWAWGSNTYGQLGDSTTVNKTSPVQVHGLTGVLAVSTGWYHSIALKIDGTVWGWGYNSQGELGDSTTIGRLTPVQMTGLCPVSNQSHNNIIMGTCYIDYNQNNVQDGGEPGYRGNLVVSSGNSFAWSCNSTLQGMFYNGADIDTTITSLQNVSPYYSYSPSQHISNFSSYGHTDTVNFALVPVVNVQDLNITLMPLNNARVGRNITNRIVFKNTGTKIMSGTVSLMMNSGLTFVSANPNYDSLTGNKIVWNYSNLVPNESRSIDVVLKVPTTATIGTTLLPSVTIEPIATDTFPSDNSFTVEQIVTGGYDPNDKTMLLGDTITTQQIIKGEYLTYLIRFQNTGNDTAFKIVVRDTLESQLDWNTFEMVSASNAYTLAIRNSNNIVWTFDNILLPDSNVDEPASHGYICYRIKPKGNVTGGDVITNTAHIYFDYNLPIPTNTSLTQVVFPVGINEFENLSTGVKLYPNPTDGKFTLSFKEPIDNGTLKIFNILGEEIYSNVIKGKQQTVNAKLKAGIYFVQIRNAVDASLQEQKEWMTKVIIQ